ncbi:transcription factor bHLH157-like isoform X2 [Primulina huaijiensis]|uniref:transcription factor bHLH157-like isoform X2 n=1 Tax=Primulina huaijiensis TaxID=1492673 RepID=UPI003CC7277D
MIVISWLASFWKDTAASAFLDCFCKMVTVEKIDSNAKETLRNLCCSNGWSYALFWGFDHTNSLLLTLKDAYYEEQMGAMIDNMLLQVHVLGGGVIGQAAFTKNDRWMFSGYHNERQSSLGSFQSLEVFQDDSELYCQFSMGIETIALISVEPWGVVQFGSTRKILETKDFVEQVKGLFRVMAEGKKFQSAENEPASSKTQFRESTTQFMSSLSHGISHSMNQNILSDAFSEDFMDLNSSMVVSSHLDNFFLESGNIFNFPAAKELSSNSEISAVTSSWPHLTSKLSENAAFSSLNANVNSASTSSLEQDFSVTHSRYSALLLDSSNCGTQRPSGLLTLEELFQENDFEEAVSKSFPGDDLSKWFSPLRGKNNTSFPAILRSSDPRGCNSPINIPEKVVSHCLSSITDTFGTDHVKETQQDWSETLMPVVDCDDLNFGADDTNCISQKCVQSDVGTISNSLFSKLGLDRILDGSASNSCTFSQSKFDIQSSSSAKRRKLESYLSGHDQVNYQDSPIFDEKWKSLNNEASLKESGLCIGNRCSSSAQNSSMSRGPDELKKSGKKKAKTGTKPRPKDRQMIQDRLVELRGLIPNGEKMSIDRLLERTIRHLNFMSGLIKHAETLKQIDKPKSGVVSKDNFNNCGEGGITWACEVGEQMMVCPLKVEDLSTPGQMLIEIQCKEQGFFLEIADLIRGFGLVILKGVLKALESNIWAHFIVEAELLQMTSQSTANATNDPLGSVISSGISLFNHHKPTISFPVNLIS